MRRIELLHSVDTIGGALESVLMAQEGNVRACLVLNRRLYRATGGDLRLLNEHSAGLSTLCMNFTPETEKEHDEFYPIANRYRVVTPVATSDYEYFVAAYMHAMKGTRGHGQRNMIETAVKSCVEYVEAAAYLPATSTWIGSSMPVLRPVHKLVFGEMETTWKNMRTDLLQKGGRRPDKKFKESRDMRFLRMAVKYAKWQLGGYKGGKDDGADVHSQADEAAVGDSDQGLPGVG